MLQGSGSQSVLKVIRLMQVGGKGLLNRADPRGSSKDQRSSTQIGRRQTRRGAQRAGPERRGEPLPHGACQALT